MKCLFVYNPHSGKSGLVSRINFILQELQSIYDEVDYKPTEYAGHARKIASDSCGKYDVLIVSGGDGTFNEIVNGLAEKENAPVVGYLPSGTVNDISRSLNIPKNLKKALNVIRDNNVYEHDIFKSNKDYGIYFCGAGAFTSTSYATEQKHKKAWGKIAYFFNCISEISDIQDFDIKITDKNGYVTSGKYIMMLIINSRSAAGFKMNTRANLNDGKVDVVLIKRENKKFITYLNSLFAIAKIFLFDQHVLKSNKYITKLQLDEFKLENSKRAIINIDGEQGSYGNMHFKVINKGLKIIVPSKTIKQQFKIQNREQAEKQKALEKENKKKIKANA